MKHYLKLYKSKDFDELKLNLKKSIKNIKEESYKITLFMRIIKNIIKLKKNHRKRELHQNIEN